MAASKIQNRSTKHDPVIREIPLACADEKAAVEFMEKQRWGGDACCPRCGSINVYQMKDSKTGLRQANYRWLCRDCKSAKGVSQFTVRTGTVFEDSRIELRHWCYGFWRAATSKKGVSALEIHRQTGLSYKSALFMLHRIRYAMSERDDSPLSGDVEVDEVFIGGKPRRYHSSNKTIKKPKSIVVGMKERGGRVRPTIVTDVTAETLRKVIFENIDPTSRVITDDWSGYRALTNHGWKHESVCHGKYEYVRGDIHTNSIEGFFGLLKRGLNGIYHAVSKKHLHRYLAEFEFRYNNGKLEDGERMQKAIRCAEGKRLMYKTANLS